MGDLILGGGGTVAVDNPSVVVEIAQPGYVRGVYLMTGPPGPPGPGGGGDPLMIRSDVASPYAYIGTAPVGTADADTGWRVSRIHLTAHDTHTATGAWDDRAGLPYES